MGPAGMAMGLVGGITGAVTSGIAARKSKIEAQKQDLLLEIAELRKMKYEEMDRSLLRDRSIAKKYDQKILFKESAFDKEKRLIGSDFGLLFYFGELFLQD